MAALYALCVLAPATAFALADGPRIAHCFADDDHHAAAPHGGDHARVHVHADGTTHEHPAPAKGNTQGGGEPHCCGLIGVTAIAVQMPDVTYVAPRREVAVVFKPEDATSRPPERLYRPPISLPAV